MESHLKGKSILIVTGSALAGDALLEAFRQNGARVHMTGNILCAFDMVGRLKFDGVVLDHGLHNEVFELCEELRDASIPFVSCSAPHRLQGLEARRKDAVHVLWRLENVIKSRDVPDAYIVGSVGAEGRQPNG